VILEEQALNFERRLKQWMTGQAEIIPQEITRMAQQVALASFAGDLLEVDEPLWGGFWQGDVISPGYRLPAIELALLRATRLDGAWPESTSIADFLASLQESVKHPGAGIWALAAAGQPCLVFARAESPTTTTAEPLLTVVWYCASTGRFHAGYRTRPGLFKLRKAVELRPPAFSLENRAGDVPGPVDWLGQAVSTRTGGDRSLAARLDLEILAKRAD
jgi:hypothetical protein